MPTVETFSYIGGTDTWVVPATVTSIDIVAWGAQGGLGGGEGGYAAGTLAVTPGETLYIRVGQEGPSSTATVVTAAFNGGGSGSGDGSTAEGGSGGGATDLRQGGTSLADRVIVAGGGGGFASSSSSTPGEGGGAEGTYQFPPEEDGHGGTQSAGGAAGDRRFGTYGEPTAGSLGQGGEAGTSYRAGGGGGGYYGGGGGKGVYENSTFYYGAGGGGSGYIGGVTNGTTSVGGRTGDGLLTITYEVSPTVVSPADNTTQDLTDGVDFSWIHNDIESDAQTGWALKRRSATPPSNGGDGLTYGAEEWWNDTARILPYASPPTPVEIDTSIASTATASSNQRKIDRCQNGVLWAFHKPSDGASTIIAEAWYSTDDGVTWTFDANVVNGSGGTGTTYTRNLSIFIDVDDYAHVVFKDNSDGYIYYLRGTPNAGRTAWTWSGAVNVAGTATSLDYPDVVAHPEGTGWKVHIVTSLSSSSGQARYHDLDVSSGGVITKGPFANDLSGTGSILGSYTNTVHKWPSIDFHHTGDGKTVAGGTPHLYAAWSAGTTGSGFGIRFKKATYSGGSWTWGTEREIDSTRYILSAHYWLNCLFDGSRVVICGSVYDGAAVDVVLHERDAADTTTTTRTLFENGTGDELSLSGSATYDGNGNVYLFGRWYTGSDYVNAYRKWNRATTMVEASVTFDATGSNLPAVSAKRGYSDGRIEFIYTDGSASPYSVKYGVAADEASQGWHTDRVDIVNSGAGTSKTITDWPAASDTYQFALATEDAGSGALSDYSEYQTLNPYEWWDGSAWVPMVETFVVSSVENVTVDGSTFADGPNAEYLWTVSTKDSLSVAGPYAAEDQFRVKAHHKWGVVHI